MGLIKVEQEEARVLQRPRSAEFEKGVSEKDPTFDDGEIYFKALVYFCCKCSTELEKGARFQH